MTQPRLASVLAALLPAFALAQTPPAPPASTTSASTTSASTQEQPATPSPPPPCTTAEHRQFDFWLGEWEVDLPDGSRAGRNRIESILDGCVLQEHWTGATGFSGKSFNLYNRVSGQWEQFWVSQGGGRLHLRGGLRDGAMVLEGRRERPDPETGKRPHERITWTPQDDGSVRQLWETSKDDGASWQVTFDGRYRKRAEH